MGGAMGVIESLGERTLHRLDGFGGFCLFCWQTLAGVPEGLFHSRRLRLLGPQLLEVGTRSVPVVMITGAFVGMVLAAQTVLQLQGLGAISLLGTILNHSVLRELGPVLSGLMLAGRVGGGLTAEIGTMRVTEQIDALRAMGCDPIRVLVVPRFLACVLLIPLLVIYADFMGILGGYAVSVHVYGVNSNEFWLHASKTVGNFDIFCGPIKSVFFGVVISLISCHKGFTCAPGAAGVGRACTQSFVASCMAVLALDFFLGVLLNSVYVAMYGVQSVL